MNLPTLSRFARLTSIRRLAVILATLTSSRADPAAEVAGAVQRLSAAANYSWEVRQGRFSPAPSRGPLGIGLPTARSTATLHVLRGVWESGQLDRDGYALIKVHTAEKILGAPQLIASRGRRERIAETPQGWLTDVEIRDSLASAGDQMAELNGRPILLQTALRYAGKALSAVRPDLQLPLMVPDIESFARVGDYIVGELSEAGKFRRSGRVYPASQSEPAKVVFRIVAGELREYLVTDHQRPSSHPEYIGTVVIIKDVGRTNVVLPEGAFDRLTR